MSRKTTSAAVINENPMQKTKIAPELAMNDILVVLTSFRYLLAYGSLMNMFITAKFLRAYCQIASSKGQTSSVQLGKVFLNRHHLNPPSSPQSPNAAGAARISPPSFSHKPGKASESGILFGEFGRHLSSNLSNTRQKSGLFPNTTLLG